VRTLAVAVGALLVAGCTSGEQVQLREGDPAARTGGVLRVATTLPGSVDPGNVYEPVGELVVRTMCTPLLTSDPETSELLPGVAESYLVTDGGTSISLRLRDDAVFSDGTRVTARDVAFTLSRIASADYASTSAERLSPIVGYPQIHGEVPTDEGRDRERLRGVTARDDENVQIGLVEPLSDFLRVLTSPLLSPVSQAAAERDPEAFARNPVCVGPYRLEAPYAPGADRLRLVRSEAYVPVDDATTRGGRGYADAVEFRFYGDTAQAAAAVAAGQADVAPARPEDVAGVQSGPGPLVEYLGLPVTAPAFEDPRVRRAVALALDREELVRRVFPRTREPATGFLPRTAEGDEPCPTLPPRRDLRGAVALLPADLDGVRVPFYFNDELRNRELVEEVARQLREGLGLVAVPTPLTFPQYLARAAAPQGFDGLFRFSWSVPHSDVDGYLHPLFSTDRIGRDNLSRFSDPDVDRALDRVAREAEEDADRRLGYAQVTELLCAQMPMVPLTTSLSRWLVDDRVGTASGQYVDGSTGRLQVRELYLR
jgi:oligopeptide transport system substrate-binding protein